MIPIHGYSPKLAEIVVFRLHSTMAYRPMRRTNRDRVICIMYRVAQLKWGQLTFLLVTLCW